MVIHATPAMNAEAASLLSRAAYIWFDRPPARDAKATMERVISVKFGALEGDFSLTEHYHEPFLVRFMYPHHRAAAVSLHDFPFEGHNIQVRPWRLEANAEQVNLRHHVRLCIENVPLYAWNDGEAQQAIGSACSLESRLHRGGLRPARVHQGPVPLGMGGESGAGATRALGHAPGS